MGMVAIPYVMAAISAYGAVSQYQAGMSAAKAQRDAAENNANATKAETIEQAYRTSVDMERARSVARANAAASGVELSGTNQSYIDDMLQAHTEDLTWLFKSGEHKSAMARWEGQQAYAAGKASARAGLISGLAKAGMSVFSGFASPAASAASSASSLGNGIKLGSFSGLSLGGSGTGLRGGLATPAWRW